MNHDLGRTKAEFRMLREQLGLSQSDLAGLLGIDVANIKRWEKPGEAHPKPFAWELLDELADTQRATVEEAVNAVADLQEQHGSLPESVQLTYWRNQSEYDAMGRDEGAFGMANANSRLVAWELSRLGVAVEWAYADDSGNIYQRAVNLPE